MRFVELSLRILVAVALRIFGIISPSKARYGKRLMFLTTAHAALVKEGILQEMSLDSFNKTFHLANDPTMLDAGSVANSSWNKANLRLALSQCMEGKCDLESRKARLDIIEKFSPMVVEKSPLWMRYSISEMTDDISNVLLVGGFTKQVKEKAIL